MAEKEPNEHEKLRELEHAAAVEQEFGCARYRPEEVAAAGVAAVLPLGFKEAESRGREILAWLVQQVAQAPRGTP